MMVALIFLFLNLVASPFKSKSRLVAENAALRHQLTVLQRKAGGRVQLTNSDRLFFIRLYRWFPVARRSFSIAIAFDCRSWRWVSSIRSFSDSSVFVCTAAGITLEVWSTQARAAALMQALCHALAECIGRRRRHRL